jgi:hypothetical protein
MKKELLEKLNKYRGYIIADTASVETALDWKLRLYFFPKTNHKAAAFHDLILNSSSFSFDKKISSYEKISYFKKLKHYEKIKTSLRFIQNTRNAMAHWHITFNKECNENKFVVYNQSVSKKIQLDTKFTNEFKSHVNFVLNDFGFPSMQSTWEF